MEDGEYGKDREWVWEDGMRDDEFRKVRMRMNGIRCGMRRGSTGKLWMMERKENRMKYEE